MLRSALFFTSILFVGIASCSNTSSETDVQEGTLKTVPPGEFKELPKKIEGLVLIDVRTPSEVANGKIEGARNINVSASDFSDQVDKLDKTKPVAVYCASGIRSARAMDIMRKKGFTTIYNLDGGIKAWNAAGLPIVKN